MSLEDEIQDRLVADAESVLEDNLDRVENLFQLHSDGTINLADDYRAAEPRIQMLVYFVAQRYAMEGGIAEEDTLSNEFFYDRIDRTESTVRDYLQELRDEGHIKKTGQSDHRAIAENLPKTLERIEEGVDDNSGNR